jgi:hypothetical protein
VLWKKSQVVVLTQIEVDPPYNSEIVKLCSEKATMLWKTEVWIGSRRFVAAKQDTAFIAEFRKKCVVV